MNRVAHFEIYTDDPEAGQPFYQDVFGWKFQKFEGGPLDYWLITTGTGNQWRYRAPAQRVKSRHFKHDCCFIARSNDQENRTARRKNLRAENGDSQGRLACLRGRSRR